MPSGGWGDSRGLESNGGWNAGWGRPGPAPAVSPHFPKSCPQPRPQVRSRRAVPAVSPHYRRAGKARPAAGRAVRSRPWRRTEEDCGALRLVRQTARVRSRPRRLPARRLLHVRPQSGGMLQRRDHGGGRRAPSGGRSARLWVNGRAVDRIARPPEVAVDRGGAGSASITPAPPQTDCAGGKCC